VCLEKDPDEFGTILGGPNRDATPACPGRLEVPVLVALFSLPPTLLIMMETFGLL
jgi:hypothetical protein